MKLERMDEFFTNRVDGYDHHMLCEVDGCREAYELLPSFFPNSLTRILDLGCGTGLELEYLFQRFEHLEVVGIDLTKSMLDELERKFKDKKLTTICGSYFDVPFGQVAFDGAISVQSFHHFKHDQKRKLYQKIYEALREESVFVLCDYMVIDESVEKHHFDVLAKYKEEHQLTDDDFIHYDTPCTVEHEMSFLREAGFKEVTLMWQYQGTKIIKCLK